MDKSTMLSELLERVVRIETKIDGYNNLREKINATEAEARSNKKCIEELKEMQSWLWKTVAGAVIASFVAAMIKWG